MSTHTSTLPHAYRYEENDINKAFYKEKIYVIENYENPWQFFCGQMLYGGFTLTVCSCILFLKGFFIVFVLASSRSYSLKKIVILSVTILYIWATFLSIVEGFHILILVDMFFHHLIGILGILMGVWVLLKVEYTVNFSSTKKGSHKSR